MEYTNPSVIYNPSSSVFI